MSRRNEQELDMTAMIQVESAARLQALVDAMDATTIAGFDQFQWTEIDSEMI